MLRVIKGVDCIVCHMPLSSLMLYSYPILPVVYCGDKTNGTLTQVTLSILIYKETVVSVP